LYCAIANLNLGYLIIAEQLLKKCLVEPEIASEAQKQMAMVYKEQGKVDQACEMYKRALENSKDHSISFELG
jgi:Tfp pilus assembly protein PilF